MKRLPTVLRTPARVVVALGLVVLVSEGMIMLLIELLHTTILKGDFLATAALKYIDPILLTVFVSPALYFLVFRPLDQQVELQRKVDELHRFHKTAIERELRVKELAAENNELRNKLSAERSEDAQALNASIEKQRHTKLFADPQQVEASESDVLLSMLEEMDEARKKIETAHHEWMVALDAVDAAIFLHDKEFRILRCNKTYQRYAGIPFKQIIGQPYFTVFPKSASPLHSCLRAFESNVEEAEEIFGSNGEIMRSRSSAVYDLQGKYLHSIHIMEDITESRQVEKKLEESESKFRSLFDSMSEGVALHEMVYDPEGHAVDYRILDVNPAFKHQTGVHANAIGELASRFYGVSPAPYFDVYEKVVRTGEPANFETYYPPLQRHFEISAFTPKLNQFATVFSDISDRKKAEESLRASEKKFRTIIESSPVALAVNDEHGNITLLNQKFTETFGYTLEDIPTLEAWWPRAYPDPELRRHIMQEWQSIEKKARNEGAEIVPMPYKVTCKDGLVRDIQFSAASMGTSNLVILYDITERIRAEENQQRLNRALALLTQCNTVLIHAEDEAEILSDICKLTVETGGYMMAWVGFAENDAEKTVRPVAQSGYEDGYLDNINISWADTELGQGPTGLAIRKSQTVINHNLLTNPNMAPWREAAIRRGYQSSVALPLISHKHVFGAITIYAGEPDAFVPEELSLLEELANDLAYGITTLRTRREHEQHTVILRESLEQSIQTIADTVEARDPYTAGHQRRVAELATVIAREMGFPEEQIRGIHLAAIVHDLGKIHVPAEILAKPTRLNEIEYMLIKMHPQEGYNILKNVKFPWPIADIILQHHEKMDGSGYPQGLKSDQILPEARILCVADVVEAISSHRPYRPGLGIKAALDEIKKGRGVLYDSDVVDACLKIIGEGKFEFTKL